MSERLVAVKYAAELSPLDMGPRNIIRYISKYKYKGEDREKLKVIYRPSGLYYYGYSYKYVSIVGCPAEQGKEHDAFALSLDTQVTIYERE